MTAADIQARIDALDAALGEIATVKSTQFDNQSTVFRDLSEIAEERARLAAQLATLRGTSRTRYAVYDKGV